MTKFSLVLDLFTHDLYIGATEIHENANSFPRTIPVLYTNQSISIMLSTF